ncbi:MAG TPA: hypothetical protein VK539_10850 [Myxococcaceae bacterium]|nr:hypothetical protein [Myxococcaceae bacterium]
MVGQPGSATAPLPRSPNTRVLPPSNEPGLWSADAPRAARKAEPPVVFDFAIPVPDIEPKAIRDYGSLCATSVDDASRFEDIAKALNRLSARERACVAIRSYLACIGQLKDHLPRRIPESQRTQDRQGLARHSQHVDRAAVTACAGVDLASPELAPVHSAIGVVSMHTLADWLTRK